MKHHFFSVKSRLEKPLSFFKRHKKKLIALTLVSSFYGLLFSFRYEIQAQLFFPGVNVNTLDHTSSGIPPSDFRFEEINIPFSQGSINGLYAGSGTGKIVYYFHGNGGDLRYFYPTLEYIQSLGYRVMALDYPGYGKSTGFPYNEEVNLAAKEFYDAVKKQK